MTHPNSQSDRPAERSAVFLVSDRLRLLAGYAWARPNSGGQATGMAVAIALDATLVRLVLVPAAMCLLGTRNWWFPGNPARMVPAEGMRAAELPTSP